jgi:hypothetical protein
MAYEKLDKEALAKLMARFPVKKLKTGNTRTCPARLSYPNCFHKSKSDDGEYAEKFGATLLFPKMAKLDILDNDVKAAAAKKFGASRKLSTLRLPFRDQGVKEGKLGYVPGNLFFRASSDIRPGIYGPNGKPLTDESTLYAGCWVIATVNAFGFAKKGDGVTFGLQNIAKIADDEPFGGVNADPDDEFDDMLDGSDDANEMFDKDESDGSEDAAHDFG